MIARIRGYPIKIVLPENVSVERRQLLEIFGAEIILSPGRRGLQRRGAPGPAPWPTSTPSGRSSTSTATRPTPGPTTRPPAPRSGRRAPRSPTSWPASAPAARCWASGTLPQGARTPTIQVLAVEPPVGELVEGLRNLDDGYIPPVFEKWGGHDLLDGKRIVRPRESIEWTRRLATDVRHLRRASPPARRWPAPSRWPSRSTQGTIVFVVCDGGWKYLSTGAWTDDLDDVVERAAEDHLLLGRHPPGPRSAPARSSRADAQSRTPGACRGPVPCRRDARPIGMFDTGFGGLTVARALIDLLPAEDLVYVGDTGRYPYGSAAPRRGAGLRPRDQRVPRRPPRREAGRRGLQHRLRRRVSTSSAKPARSR